MFKDSKKFSNGILGILKIKTITNVCPLITEYSNTNAELKDIIDQHGFPYISTRYLRLCLFNKIIELFKQKKINNTEYHLLSEMIKENFSFKITYDDNIMLSDAYLDSYWSYIDELSNMDNTFVKSKNRITEVFADFLSIEKDGQQINTVLLKPGLNFSSLVFINKKYHEAFEKLVSLTDRVGEYQEKNVGKVYCSISWVQDIKNMFDHTKFINFDFNDKHHSIQDINSKYARLNYNIVNITGFCSNWSFNEDIEQKDYISGSHIFDLLNNRIFSNINKEELKQKITCSNAYLSIKDTRSVPIPASFMTEKLNKHNLKDRTIFGCARKKGKYVQLKRVGGEYVVDENKKTVFSEKPKMFNTYMELLDTDNPEKLKSYKFNVVAPYQTFKGYIEGPTSYIKKLFEYFISQRMFQFGLFSNLGFGISAVSIDNIHEINEPEECPVTDFILKCNSPIKLWNKYGMYTTKTQDLISAISKKYNINNNLEVVNVFKKIKNIESFDKDKWFVSKSQQVIDSGSIIYIKVTDGSVDLNKIRNIVIGEDSHCGYGEISCYEAVNIYDKSLDKLYDEQHLFLKQTSDVILQKAEFRNRLHFNLLFRYIQNEATYRKLDDLTKHIENSPIPKVSLLDLRDKSNVYIDNETIFNYYLKIYEETSYE